MRRKLVRGDREMFIRGKKRVYQEGKRRVLSRGKENGLSSVRRGAYHGKEYFFNREDREYLLTGGIEDTS